MRKPSLFERASDLPMMAERVDDASDAPAVLVADGINLFRSGLDGACKSGIRIRNRHDDTHGNSAKGFRAEVVMFGRLVAEPELCSANRYLGNHAAATVETKFFYRSK